ncbi:hypothetical protein [Zooshikella ganghwensis]|uniref:hypothetical protein n=1 Tax=Zooshikella ganghwensis TaxID=202772 RepID=UPI0012FBA693|nr:hypothetical protein [Zooshikella ganghwensis]
MIRKYVFCSLLLVASTVVSAVPYSQDTGVIKRFHASNSGAVAVSLNAGFPKASGDRQCPNAAGDWAGDTNIDPTVKSALLAAYLSGKRVTVTTQGCNSGGGWYRLIDVYLD